MTYLHLQNNRGYTLLFSVIVASVVLAIAAFILSVSRKQFLLSSVWRDSTTAIYAADSGAQCATQAYQQGKFDDLTTAGTFPCHNAPALPYQFTDFGSYYETSDIVGYMDNGSCYKIKITSYTTPSNRTIRIESKGYNISDQLSGSCPVFNPRTQERAIRIEYNTAL